MTMTDDYGLPSLYVKRVPHSIHSEGAAMTCYESYVKRKHSETPAWDACDTVHDKRSDADWMKMRKYVDDKGKLVALCMKPEMLAYMDSTMPFLSFNRDVYVVGRHIAKNLMKIITKADTMQEIVWRVEPNRDFSADMWGPPMLNEIVRDSDQWYKLKGLIENCDVQSMELSKMKERMYDADNFRYPLAQRIALARFDMMNNDYKILDYSDGAIMLRFAGMMVGIEPDGYTHS